MPFLRALDVARPVLIPRVDEVQRDLVRCIAALQAQDDELLARLEQLLLVLHAHHFDAADRRKPEQLLLHLLLGLDEEHSLGHDLLALLEEQSPIREEEHPLQRLRAARIPFGLAGMEAGFIGIELEGGAFQRIHHRIGFSEIAAQRVGGLARAIVDAADVPFRFAHAPLEIAHAGVRRAEQSRIAGRAVEQILHVIFGGFQVAPLVFQNARRLLPLPRPKALQRGDLILPAASVAITPRAQPRDGGQQLIELIGHRVHAAVERGQRGFACYGIPP